MMMKHYGSNGILGMQFSTYFFQKGLLITRIYFMLFQTWIRDTPDQMLSGTIP